MEEHPVVRASQESGGCGAIAGFCVIGFLVLCAVIAILDDGPQAPPSVNSRASPSVSEKSLGYQLAYIHNGFVGASPKEPSEWLVSKFQSALDGLEAKCPETRQELSDLGVAGYLTLRKNRPDVQDTLRDIFTGWYDYFQNDAGDGDSGPCDSILASLLLIYEQTPR